MNHERGLEIHFVDGTKIKISFPVQALNEMAALLRLEEIIRERQIIVEADGAVMIIPFENIKYVRVSPAQGQLPGYSIRGASVNE
jgi:hypothetical protein